MDRTLAFDIDPKKFRRLYALILLGGLLLIWTGFLIGRHFIEKDFEQSLKARLEAEAFVLEDHVNRTLDTVAARLQSAAAFTTPEAMLAGQPSPARLHDMISEDPVVRSISLVNADGRVITSSNEANIGLVLPPGTLPQRPQHQALDSVRFGRVLPHRDLNGFVKRTEESGISLWLATTDVAVDGQTHHWVAVINPAFFQNFWIRVHQDRAAELGLFDYHGRRIISQNPVDVDETVLAQNLAQHIEGREIGFFNLGSDQRWAVAYRGGMNHPVVFAIIGDRQRLRAEQIEDQHLLAGLAALASLLLALVVALFYRSYLRYEASITEMGNQGKAISAHLMVSESDSDGKIIRVNQALLDKTGYSRQELLGQNYRIFNSGLHSKEFYRELWREVLSGHIWKGTLRNRCKSGEHVWVNVTIVPFTNAWGKVTRYVCLYSDISEAIVLTERLKKERRLRNQLVAMNNELQNDANTDPLTGIANRRGFDQFASQAVEEARRNEQPLSVLIIDLDYFKSVNDTYGHDVGDEVLKVMSQRWLMQIRSTDMLARLGGEEFCVLLPNSTLAQAERVAQKIRAATTGSPVTVKKADAAIELNVTSSIGLACSQQMQHIDITPLMHAADAALYQAKHAGRDRIVSH